MTPQAERYRRFGVAYALAARALFHAFKDDPLLLDNMQASIESITKTANQMIAARKLRQELDAELKEATE